VPCRSLFFSCPTRRSSDLAVFNIQSPNGQGAAVTALAASGARVSGHTVSIEDGSNVKLVVSMSKGLGEINGVAERDGKPLAGAIDRKSTRLNSSHQIISYA